MEPCVKMEEVTELTEEELLEVERAEQLRKEVMQTTHYLYLNQLQSMAHELPGKYQQRLPYDLLSGLASKLLDGTMFDIVSSLAEVQQLEEQNLSTQRLRFNDDHRAQKQEVQRRHRDTLQLAVQQPHNLRIAQEHCRQELEQLERRHEEEVKRRDMKIILQLDQKVMDQQSILEKAGIPGFVVTNNPQEIRLQMYLLDFIAKLGRSRTNRS